jgi:DMSO/TMAO reductase YedYZ heme-binding membrane subunit
VATLATPPPPPSRPRQQTLKDKRIELAVSYDVIVRTILRIPTFMPFLFVAPAVLIGAGSTLSTGEADTLGTGSEILLILCLLVTPVITLTGWRWLAPMRKWYGIMFGLSATLDGLLAVITTTDFAGGPVGRVTGHIFLFIGLLMVTILLPILITSNKRSQKWLGKYWKWLQRGTYVVWALLLLHLALLFGFGPGTNPPDGMPVFHQRLYQLSAVSIFLVIMRVPAVKRWATGMRAEGRSKEMWLVLAPVIAVFLVGYFFIEHEFLFKGIGMFELNPPDD